MHDPPYIFGPSPASGGRSVAVVRPSAPRHPL